MAYETNQNQSKTKTWAVAAVVGIPLIAVIGGLGWMINLAKKNTLPTPTGQVSQVTAEDWQMGNSNSGITLVEYGDFQCPACGNYEPIVEQVRREQAGRINFVFRNFPLQQHQYGQLSAFAAEAAGKQGKFWEMHDLLYANQKDWSTSNDARVQFKQYAQRLGLDVDRFNSDMDSEAIRTNVSEDVNSGLTAGVNSTPTFFLNGKQIRPTPTVEDFVKAIDDAAAQSAQANQPTQ